MALDDPKPIKEAVPSQVCLLSLHTLRSYVQRQLIAEFEPMSIHVECEVKKEKSGIVTGFPSTTTSVFPFLYHERANNVIKCTHQSFSYLEDKSAKLLN